MPFLIVTAKAIDANSYLTVSRANEILRSRLYTTNWDDATSTPDAEGYLANGSASPAAGTVAIDTGVGTFGVGTVIKFAGHDTEYTVQTALSAPGSLSILPVLTASVADDEEVVRLTGSSREKALIYATRLLDDLMNWFGAKRTLAQSLRFPRSGLVDRDGDNLDDDTVPATIEEATAELALVLLGSDKFALPDLLGKGIREAKVGSLAVKVDKAGVEEVIPDNVLSLISHLGEINPDAERGSRVVDLVRA